MRKAKWGTEYDMHEDKCYECPQCQDCFAPIHRYEDGKFRCISCREEYELTPDMIEWYNERDGEKVEMQDCVLGCGGKACVEQHYVKNPVTLEWQTAWGKCTKCDFRFIV